jgi:uncharacterized protein YbaR (Trm112 family)
VKQGVEILNILSCPRCDGSIALLSATEKTDNEIRTGILGCRACSSDFPIQEFIPRFVPAENYAQSFGFQWNRHARTQLDRLSGIPLSRNRFFRVTEWPERLEGKMILEAGCGAGRFTQIALETGAEVYTFDYSTAVDANLANNGSRENLHLF